MTRLALVLLCVAFAGSARADLVIDEIDTSDYASNGTIVFCVDVVRGSRVDGSTPRDLKVTIDGEDVPGTFEVKSFRDSGRQLAVAVLMSFTTPYRKPVDAEHGAKAVVDLEVAGFKRFFERLAPTTRVTLFVYGDEDLRQFVPWTNDPLKAAKELYGEFWQWEPSTVTPHFYLSIQKALLSFQEEPTLPRRRVLVVMSDGVDQTAPEKRERKIAEIVDTTMTPEVNVAIHALGFTTGKPEPLVDLGTMAVKSGGVAHDIAADDFDQIKERIAGLADDLMNQQVITFRPDEPIHAKELRTLRLELRDGAGVVQSAEKTAMPDAGDGASSFPVVWLVVGVGLVLVAGLALVMMRARSAKTSASA